MEIPKSAVNEEGQRAEEEALATLLAALVDQYAGALYRVAFSVLRNAADAEDAVQEAFLRVLRHRQTLGEVRDHRVWLIRSVWNIVLDRKRRTKTRPGNRRMFLGWRGFCRQLAFRLKTLPLRRSTTPRCWPVSTSFPRRNARCCSFRPLKSFPALRSRRCSASASQASARACSARAT